ncbi:MAG TPA: hypothetical protein VHC19_10240 [Pirellulales bacterium]|nr:hypothetical protein [Pirellulales bacterium]
MCSPPACNSIPPENQARSTPTGGKRGLARRGRSAVLCAAAAWIAAQLVFSVAVDYWFLELRDPEFANKLSRLRCRCAEFPTRPKIVVLGSSRSDYGVCPGEMAYLPGALDQPPLVFNFAMLGAGPITEATMLRQLLSWDVRPDGLLVELNAVLLHQTPQFKEENWLHAERLGWPGLQTLQRYSSHPWLAGWRWLRARLAPCYCSRHSLLARFAPRWVEPSFRQDRRTPPDEDGWLEHEPAQVTAAERKRRVKLQLEYYAKPLEDFSVSPNSDAALREMLAVCRQRGIAVALLIMPESSALSNARGVDAARRFESYVTALSCEYSVPLFDARGWTQDSDFADAEHLLPASAKRFSRRLCDSTALFAIRTGRGAMAVEHIAGKPSASKTR